MRTITKPLFGTIVSNHAQGGVFATFLYRADDPYSVMFWFPTGVRWLVGRDLLLQGLRRRVGEGDVVIWPEADGVLMVFRSPTGRISIRWETDGLVEALRETELEVPLGAEVLDWDAELRLLGEAR